MNQTKMGGLTILNGGKYVSLSCMWFNRYKKEYVNEIFQIYLIIIRCFSK